MRPTNCSKEAAVSMAVRTGTSEESLAAHAAQCAACREVMQAARWMKALSRDAGGSPKLPDAGELWRRAQLTETLNRKQAEAEKAQKALQWAEVGLLTAVALGLMAWGLGNGRILEMAASWLVAAMSPQNWIAAYYAASSTPASFWPAVGAAFLAALFLASQILAEE